jgi:outer membrane protein assembly factor BamA
MKYKYSYYILAFIFACIVSSCGNQKYLKSHSLSTEKSHKRIFEEHMVVNNKISFREQNYKIQEDYDNLIYEISTIIRQVPDRSFIKGFRQWVYHLNDTLSVPYNYDKKTHEITADTLHRKSNGLKKWLHQKVGAAPIILDTALTRETAESMQRFLNNKAYFQASVNYSIQKKKHKATISYTIQTGKPLLIDSLVIASKDSSIKAILEDIKGSTVLKARTPLSQANLLAEKNRLTLAIRNRGYYEFNANYIVFQADTVNAKKYQAQKKKLFSRQIEQAEPRATVYLEVLPFTDTSIQHPIYTVSNVLITPNEYILKAHQKRKIKKDSFLVVERILKDRQRVLRLDADDLMLPNDLLIREKLNKKGVKIKWVQRSLPKVKKITLRDRSEIQAEDRLVHIILRKIIKNKNGEAASYQQIKKNQYIRDKVISDAISIKSGDLYNYKDIQESVKSVNNLAVFRFPRIEFVPSSDAKAYHLDCLVKMQPGKKQEWGADFELNNNNTTAYSSSIGIFTNVFYRNKNIFKGAETFEVSVQGGIDFKVTGYDSTAKNNFIAQAVNLLDINLETSFYIPRFLGLNFIEKLFKMENPKTKVSLGYQFLQQSSDFQISSFYTKIGYNWNKGPEHAFMWNPVLVNLTLEPVLDLDFASLLRTNNITLYESLRASYLIPSMDFSYTYATPENKTKGGTWFFKSYFELSGNLAYLLDKATDPNNDLQFFGVDYAQYFRTDIDLRYAYKLHKRHSIVSRLMLGILIPYGNSEGTDVPFIKRFTLGGPNSMRAWNLRYLGPADQAATPGAEFQMGDLRFEFNSEYRFMFSSWFGGAFFVDVGNIWLLNTHNASTTLPYQNPKTGVLTDKFYEQLAVGAGLGLRVDLSFFIFRFDFALQLREPQGYRVKDNGTVQYWNFDPFVLEDRFKFIIAIGYPF